MVASVLFLNYHQKYKALASHVLYNVVFCGYLLFIVLNRERSLYRYKFSSIWEEIINISEHGLFAMVICLKIIIYLGIFTKWNFQKRRVTSVLLLNLVGVGNEFFQNSLQSKGFLPLCADAQKDLIINLIGSIVFYLFCKKVSLMPLVNTV
jgi:hypothetical protein